ncbi:MAG: NfeD family protein, partial [Mycobacteriales bacterium]
MREAAMWAIAGILLALVVVASLLGLHSGPHVHLVGGVLGLAAAGWLVAIAVSQGSWSGLWVLFSADLVMSAGMGVLAWRGLAQRRGFDRHLPNGLVSEMGVAVTDLSPEGVVRVRSEQWSAVVLNGFAAAGSAVQVLAVNGLRLEVWAEQPDAPSVSAQPSASTKPSVSAQPSASPQPTQPTQPSASPQPTQPTQPSASPQPTLSAQPSA